MTDPSASTAHALQQQQQQPQPQPMRGHGTHRVHSSCDRCRSRKTKCIDPVPGPCRYCARTGSVCQIATPRRKRPYYHVTEEEYQCAMRILEHLFPDRELNLVSLRQIAQDVVDGRLVGSVVEGEPVPSVSEETSPDEGDSPHEADPALDSVNDLHEPLGTMMKDSTGRYRYVGAHSEIPFNAAICSMGREAELRKNPNIIGPPKVGLYPPSLPTTLTNETGSPGRSFFLPRRELCDYYISRFLEDVHCTHWFYSIEQFLYRVESTYSGKAGKLSNSWMCSLYAILGLGAANYEEPSGQSPLPPGSPAASDEKSSEDYIALAKELMPSVYEEADIDSIRALAIMSIALENLCSRTTSYLYMGASIQVAYSLGLHRDSITDSGASMEREQNRRIWWTLFNLDLEIASRGGSPTLIDERYLRITTPLPSEQVSTSLPIAIALTRLQHADPISWHAHSPLLAHNLRLPLPPQARDHPSRLHRAVSELPHPPLHHRLQAPPLPAGLAATHAAAPQARRPRPTDAQARRRRAPPAVLGRHHPALPAVPAVSRAET
ncbi:hypothetical protein PMIN02_000322 [Paraphaeosphaeria minitans]